MDKESKKALDDKYGISDDMETFAAKVADKQDNPTLGDLAKEFPNKTYKELEDYRDSDRQEEATQTPLTESQRNLVEHIEAAQIPLTESQKKQADLEPIEGHEQDNPTLWEIATTHKVSYADAVPIQEDMRLKRDAMKEACIIGEMRKDRTPLANMKKRAQEAEGELSIMKQLETNRVKEAQAKSEQLQDELDRVKLDNNNLYTRVADALEVNEHHQNLNGKLRVRITELEDDNQKISKQIEDQLERARKSGM